MKDFAKKYLDWYKGLSKVVRILICLLWDIPSNLYRFSKSALKDNILGIIIAVLLAFFGGWILCVIDIITIATMDKIFWLDDLGLEDKDSDSKAEDKKDNE